MFFFCFLWSKVLESLFDICHERCCALNKCVIIRLLLVADFRCKLRLLFSLSNVCIVRISHPAWSMSSYSNCCLKQSSRGKVLVLTLKCLWTLESWTLESSLVSCGCYTTATFVLSLHAFERCVHCFAHEAY